ncbi:MAG: FmdB family zinc ribbon protein [Janthinobacterium lividum]
MPIYAYRCESCGFEKDALRKLSDPPLTLCPQCGKETFVKKVTAAGFQLKGSGWYVTDFRDNGAKKAAPNAKSSGSGEASSSSTGGDQSSAGGASSGTATTDGGGQKSTAASSGDSGGAAASSASATKPASDSGTKSS